MNSNSSEQRRRQREAAFDGALRIVAENESLLTPEDTKTLRKCVVAAFVRGEINDLVHEYLGPEAIYSTLFDHTPGRRR